MSFLTDDKKEKIKNYLIFCKKELGIKSMPLIKILNGRKDLKTTANYDYSKKEKIIKVNGKNRALIDIMRSLGHELVHHKQWEDGKLKNPKEDGSDGSDIENEAHAKAGLLIRRYIKIDESVYDDIT